MPRAIDHLVLPVASLKEARARYEALGFAVNADGIHPFGTANCCIFFQDGTFFEPLAINDAKRVEEVKNENSFIQMDARFRKTCGDEGLSAISLQTNDPDGDEADFRKAGFAGPSKLSFERKAVHLDGSFDTLKVNGAFCLSDDIPSHGFFTCCWIGTDELLKRIKAPGHHKNGVLGIKGVSYTSDDLSKVKSYLAAAFGAKFDAPDDDQLILQLPNALIEISRNEQGPQHQLTCKSVNLTVTKLGIVEDILKDGSINYSVQDQRIVVPPALGQGVALVFEEG